MRAINIQESGEQTAPSLLERYSSSSQVITKIAGKKRR